MNEHRVRSDQGAYFLYHVLRHSRRKAEFAIIGERQIKVSPSAQEGENRLQKWLDLSDVLENAHESGIILAFEFLSHFMY